MKKYIVPFLALFMLMAASCSTKFNIAAPYQNITVVYALLDRADTAHYVRIEKAFMDQNKSAVTMAQVADSSFYSNLNVKIERIDYFNSGNVYDTIHLTRVDLNQEGYTKQTGAFFNAPNYAYKFKNTLDPSYTYRIIITNLSTGQVDSSETAIIDDDASALGIELLDNFYANQEGLDFSQTLLNSSVKINATYTSPIASNYNFEGYSTPIDIAQAILTFNWVDTNIAAHTTTARSFDYNAGYIFSISQGNAIAFTINDLSLYDAVSSNIGDAPTNVQRIFKPCTLTLYVSTPEYSTYYAYTTSQSTGVNASQIEPIYTNIKGANALGLYTTRGYRQGSIALNVATIDSMKLNPITSGLNILYPYP